MLSNEVCDLLLSHALRSVGKEKIELLNNRMKEEIRHLPLQRKRGILLGSDLQFMLPVQTQ